MKCLYDGRKKGPEGMGTDKGKNRERGRGRRQNKGRSTYRSYYWGRAGSADSCEDSLVELTCHGVDAAGC